MSANANDIIRGPGLAHHRQQWSEWDLIYGAGALLILAGCAFYVGWHYLFGASL